MLATSPAEEAARSQKARRDFVKLASVEYFDDFHVYPKAEQVLRDSARHGVLLRSMSAITLNGNYLTLHRNSKDTGTERLIDQHLIQHKSMQEATVLKRLYFLETECRQLPAHPFPQSRYPGNFAH